VIYTILAVIAAFSGGVYIGFSSAMAGFVASVKRGTMHELIHDYEEAFGTSIKPKE
jgi:hypothetical protein